MSTICTDRTTSHCSESYRGPKIVAEVDAQEMGQRVRGARANAGLSVEALAFKASCTPATVSRLERGMINDPGYRVISRIAVALGFQSPDDMLGGPIVTLAELEQLYNERLGVKPQQTQTYRDFVRQLAHETATAPGPYAQGNAESAGQDEVHGAASEPGVRADRSTHNRRK